jgi:hypothetical protein
MGLLKAIPSAVAAVSFSVLSLAFVHEWSFYSTLGELLQPLMTVTDYFNSAIGWLPYCVVGAIIGILLRTAEHRSHNFASQEVRNAYYKQNRFWWLLNEAPMALLSLLIVVLGTAQLLFGNWYTRGLMDVAFIFIWGRFLYWLISHEKVSSALTRDIAFIIFFVPPLLFFAYISGLTEGYSSLTKKEPVYFGKMKGGDHEEEWIVLRNLARGIIVRRPEANRFSFIKWDDIVTFETKIQPPDTRSVVCRVTGFACLFGK